MADEPGDEPPAENPSQKFLDLAAQGKDEWNKWRQANKDERVTFAGTDFSKAPNDQINFSGFEFGDHANFSHCKWRGVKWEEIQKDPEAFAPGRAWFAGAPFSAYASFDGAAFGDYASFDSATFGKRASFAGAAFGHGADFTGAAFGDFASFADAAFNGGNFFDRATFGNNARFASAAFGFSARFAGAAFGFGADFTGATFDGYARFADATFGVYARFASATFGDDAGFKGAAFGDGARFDRAAFGDGAHFDNIFFKGRVVFTGESVEDSAVALKLDTDAREALEKRLNESWKQFGSGPDRFLTISFANARFDGEADFSGRTFEMEADFTDASFYRPPDFDAGAAAARIDFSGVHVGFVPPGRLLHWTSQSKVPVRLRRLRKIAEETKNHDLERDLYIEERKAERGVYLRQVVEELKKAPEELKKKLEDINKQKKHVWLEWRLQRRARIAHRLGIAVKIARLAVHFLWIAVMGIYWALADYGRSFARPAVWLVSSGFFFYWCYSKILAPLMAKAPDIEKYKQAVRMLALGNTVPFVGPLTIDADVKKFLFCPSGNANCLPPIPPEGYQFLVLSQNLFSITLVFFIGLALRNYFRIK